VADIFTRQMIGGAEEVGTILAELRVTEC